MTERASPNVNGNPQTQPADAAPRLTPLTAGQESLYILSRLASDRPVYNIPFAFRMRGALHLRAFQEALRLSVARHHALRSRIVETENGLRQIVLDADEPAFEFHDLAKTDPPQ